MSEKNTEKYEAAIVSLEKLTKEKLATLFADTQGGLLPLLCEYDLVEDDEHGDQRAISQFVTFIEHDRKDMCEEWKKRPALNRRDKARRRSRLQGLDDLAEGMMLGKITPENYSNLRPEGTRTRKQINITILTPPFEQWQKYREKYIYAGYGEEHEDSETLEGLMKVEAVDGADMFFWDEDEELIGHISYNSNGKKEHDRRLEIL
ncbi:hypothetical protein HDU86_001935 [Geranomyces michiganensis]|nr:hypothetical protein HDU86_001935 [Geranomyces michiganensis]